MKLYVFKLKTMYGVVEMSVSTYLSRWTDSSSEIGSVRKRAPYYISPGYQIKWFQEMQTQLSMK